MKIASLKHGRDGRLVAFDTGPGVVVIDGKAARGAAASAAR